MQGARKIPDVEWRASAYHCGIMRSLLLALLLAASSTAAAQQPRYDILITNGTVIDGTGSPRYRADVAISGDRIVAVSRTPLAKASAKRVIDATNRIVAPGFIDLHAHLEPLPQLPGAKSAVTQGVTLALGGPDGSSPSPLASYMNAREKQGIGINVAYLVGHNTVRRAVMGEADRAPTSDELARMRAMIAQGMHDGAFGMSTGLKYIPGAYSNVDEVVSLAQVAADSGGIYTSHLREEGLGLLDGVAEAIETLHAKGWLLGVATGKSDRGLAHILAHHGLAHRFVTLQTADRHPSKPHPSMIEAAIAEADAAPETTAMIGDTSFDILMARAAGAHAVGVAWGYHTVHDLLQSGAHHVVEHAAALPAQLEAL
jgi:HAD superfamily hydrolase (TIGR01509 family)